MLTNNSLTSKVKFPNQLINDLDHFNIFSFNRPPVMTG